MSLIIRPVQRHEAELLAGISRATFLDAFAADNTAADMALYLSEHLSVTQLSAELQAPGCSFYVAETEGVIAAYLKLNTGAAQKEQAGDTSLEIERIYVAKAYWRMKIGQQLLDFALDSAVRAGLTRVWLGVWEHNERALAFYRKQGFVAFGTHDFMLGTDRQTDILMELFLSAADNTK